MSDQKQAVFANPIGSTSPTYTRQFWEFKKKYVETNQVINS